MLLMNVVQDGSPGEHGDAVESAQRVLGEALRGAIAAGHRPQALLSVADSPWAEIDRVVREYRCESLLLGRARLDEPGMRNLEQLMRDLPANVAFLLAEPGWSLDRVDRILVPIGGRSGHYALRARMLGSLCRTSSREVTWLRVVRRDASDAAVRQALRTVENQADDASARASRIVVERSDDPRAAIFEHAKDADLMIVGLHAQRGQRVFGEAVPQLVRDAPCACLIISVGE